MSDASLNTFPSNKLEALAMLYLQNQDLSGLTPEELLEKYLEVYNKIREHSKEIRQKQRGADWFF